MTTISPQPGDWVKVTAKVVKLHPNDIELGLEFFSKTDQHTVFVRRDLCEPTEKPIPAEPGDKSVALLAGIAYQRLGDGLWFVAGGATNGFTWEQLNGFGEVEVIHHG